MKRRELCITCRSDKDCGFPRKTPVLFCEEFGSEGARPVRADKVKKIKGVRLSSLG